MDNFVPELAGIYILDILWVIRIDGVLLAEALSVNHRLHEFIGDLHRDVCAGDLSGLELGIYEAPGIRVLD